MTMDEIYSTFQFPMVVMLFALGLALGMRARSIIGGDLTVPSAAILICLSGFMVAWAVRLSWWHVRWVLRALELHTASEAMVGNVMVPLICNLVALGFGGAVLAIAAYPAMGRLSVPATVAGIAMCVAIGGHMSGALS
jgi:hypothetical protein